MNNINNKNESQIERDINNQDNKTRGDKKNGKIKKSNEQHEHENKP